MALDEKVPTATRVLLAAATLAVLPQQAGWAQSPPGQLEPPGKVDVYVSGEGGYHTYRIPSVVVTGQGTLLAFCEGRKQSSSDAGDIDLLLRRSTDRGRTWSEPQVVWDDGANTCGNPCAVVDGRTGTIWLLLTWNAGAVHEARIAAGLGEDSRRVFVTSTTDDGVTWAAPREISADVKAPGWSWYATGPGAGIQLRSEQHRGRMVIPCDHKVPGDGGERYLSHVIFSDDGGETWELGGSSPRAAVNECEVVELEHGRLMLNMRSYDPQRRTRQVCFSDDGGVTWRDQRTDEALIEPICQASLRRLRWDRADRPGVLLFSNPASATRRERLTIRASYDDGESWEHARVLHAGGSAYSCLCVLDDETIGCLYEADGYARIVFARFDLEWVRSAPGPRR